LINLSNNRIKRTKYIQSLSMSDTIGDSKSTRIKSIEVSDRPSLRVEFSRVKTRPGYQWREGDGPDADFVAVDVDRPVTDTVFYSTESCSMQWSQ
jgi:hypothetical protein